MRRFTELNVVQAIIFLFIPLMLIIVNGSVLDSISAYVYKQPIAFCVSLTLASALFFYDGFVYRERFYNMPIGISLMGVILTPHIDYPLWHHVFAAIFFIGSLFNIAHFSSKKERPIKLGVCLGVIAGMMGHFLFNWYTLFWAEWIGMIPITIHFALESLEKID